MTVHRRVKEPEGLAAHLERTRADLLTEARETVADRAGGRVNERWLDEDGEAIRQLTIPEMLNHAPSMLTWTEEPGARAGDVYVFTWISHTWRDPSTGETLKTKCPGIHVRLLAHPVRHRKGHWQAPYVWCGLDRAEYLARGSGTTGDRRRAIDNEVEVARRAPTELELKQSRARAEMRRTAEKQAARKPGRRERHLRRAA